MLSALTQYAQDQGLVARAGFKLKAVKGYIWLTAQGEFLDLQPTEKGAEVYAPDIGSAANGTRYCNFPVEKAKIILSLAEDAVKDKNIPTKHAFYRSLLVSGGGYEPAFLAIDRALGDEAIRAQMIGALKKSPLKPGDPLGFIVDSRPVHESSAYFPWWAEYRTRFSAGGTGDQSRCLITGELTSPLSTVDKVRGLLSVGGHTSGDAFLCFDKDAFQSYGLKQSANAPVSEEGMTAVNAALTDLIPKAPTLSGAKIVHWYSKEASDGFDLFMGALDGLYPDMELDELSLEPAEEVPISDEDRKEDEREALARAKRFFAALENGERPQELSARYYILPLSGAGGRIMVRGWFEGSFESLYHNINTWFSDLRMVSCGGGGRTNPPKLKSLQIRLLKPGGDPKKVWERMDHELKGLSMRLLDSIINCRPLPDEVASRSLQYIRSGMLSANDKEGSSSTNKIRQETLAFQLLKVWLIRRQRQRGEKHTMGENIKQSPKTPAYSCGQLMAIYGAIQMAAMPEVNVGVVERYYASAITTPAFVLGKLSALSKHHLAKLDQDRGGLAHYFRRQLETVAAQMDVTQLPRTLDLEQQSQFALGYYQQRAAMYKTEKADQN